MIGVIDCGTGNLFSIRQALTLLDEAHRTVRTPNDVHGSDILLLPGVGAFGDAMTSLNKSGLSGAIRTFAKQGNRVVGICLGMQLLADESEEFGHHAGLGLIPGRVRRIPNGSGPTAIRVPNMGWRKLHLTENADGATWSTVVTASDFYAYFVHSYFFEPALPESLQAWIAVNRLPVTAAVGLGNVLGFQFHPEKSGERGIDLLKAALDR